MRFFVLQPEVAGGLGRNTVLSRSTHPPVVTHLHYEFEGWPNDDLLTTFPCFIVSERLAHFLQEKCLSGFELQEVEVSLSEQFEELYPERAVPEFIWLNVNGEAGSDDFGVDVSGRLVVSETALGLLRSMNLQNCEAAEYIHHGLQK
jgi:hypothetical protein